MHLTPARVDPNFPPIISRDLYSAFRLDRLFVCVERFHIDSNFVLWTMDVSYETRIDVVTLSRDAHGVGGNDLATRRIHEPRLDAVFEILVVIVARRVERQSRFAG